MTHHPFPFSSWVPQPDDPLVSHAVRTVREIDDRLAMTEHRVRAVGTRAAEVDGVEVPSFISKRHPPIVLGRRRDNLLTWALIGAALAALLMIFVQHRQ